MGVAKFYKGPIQLAVTDLQLHYSKERDTFRSKWIVCCELLSANFAHLARNLKGPKSKTNWTISGTGPGLVNWVFFPEQGSGSVHLCPVPSSVQATLVGDASATDITEEAALARNAGSEPQLALSVFLCHSDDDWTQTHCNDQNKNQQLSFFA